MQSQHHHWLDDPRPGKIPPLFQVLIKRIASRLPLVESVLEVARYAEHSGLDEYWGWFIQDCPNIPEEVLTALVNTKCRTISVDEGLCDSWGWWVATRRQDLPEGVLKALANNENWVIRYLVLKRSQTLPEEVLKSLSQDPDWEIRRAVASREDLPEQLRRRESTPTDL